MRHWSYCGMYEQQLQKMHGYDFVKGISERGDRHGHIWYELTMKCSGPQYIEALYNLVRDFGWIFSFTKWEDPTECECKQGSGVVYNRSKREAI